MIRCSAGIFLAIAGRAKGRGVFVRKRKSLCWFEVFDAQMWLFHEICRLEQAVGICEGLEIEFRCQVIIDTDLMEQRLDLP